MQYSKVGEERAEGMEVSTHDGVKNEDPSVQSCHQSGTTFINKGNATTIHSVPTPVRVAGNPASLPIAITMYILLPVVSA